MFLRSSILLFFCFLIFIFNSLFPFFKAYPYGACPDVSAVIGAVLVPDWRYGRHTQLYFDHVTDNVAPPTYAIAGTDW